MALIETTGLHHVRLTVTDLERSKRFYTDVLGFELAAESPGDPSDPAVRNDPDQLYGGVVFVTNGMLFGLRPVADAADDSCPSVSGWTTSASACRRGPRWIMPSAGWTKPACRTAQSASSRRSDWRSCPSATRTACTWS